MILDETLSLKENAFHGGKNGRFKILFCSNVNDSRKFSVQVTGKSRNPSCFKNVKKFSNANNSNP